MTISAVLRLLFRPVLLAGAVLVSCVASVTAAVTAAVTLTATALIVPGTGVPNATEVWGYIPNAINYYVAPTTDSCGSVCTPVPVNYLAQWWPFNFENWGGLKGAKFNVSVASGVTQLTSYLVGQYNPSADNPVYIFGYSQGTKVSSLVKSSLSMLSAGQQSDVSFTLLSNLTRPNGGLLERFAALGTMSIFGVTFGQPTVTNTAMKTTDISFQYDGISDLPLYPIDLLADLNAAMGAVIVHPDLLSPNQRHPDGLPGGLTPAELAAAMSDPANIEVYGDTTYISIPAKELPLLIPITEFGANTHTQWLTTPLVDLVQPALKVIIEAGYNRSLSYGVPAPFRLIPQVNPITFTVDLAKAVGQGVQAALHDITGSAHSAATVTRTGAPASPSTTAASASAAASAPVSATASATATSGQGPTPITPTAARHLPSHSTGTSHTATRRTAA